MMRNRVGFFLLMSGLALLISARGAEAGFVPSYGSPIMTYGFVNITNNKAADAATGQAQLFLDVYGWTGTSANQVAGEDSVLFVFRNEGPNASSITDVYFDDGSLLGISDVFASSGVSFTPGSASPGELPGGNNLTPVFETTAGFLADSDSPTQPNGVNPTEWLGIAFTLQNGQTASNVLTELSRLNSELLRVGIRVQGFTGGGSESFVNGNIGTPGPTGDPEPVPVPGGLALLGSALLSFCGYRTMQRRPQQADEAV